MKSRVILAAYAVLISVLLLSLAGCGGARRVNTALYIPDVDTSAVGDSYYREGWQNLKAGKPKAALKMFQQSSAADEQLYIAFGYSFLAQNRFSFARRNFQKALELNPESLQARLGMASLYELLKDNEKAFAAYSRLLAQYPENAWIKVRYQYIKSTQTQYYLKRAEEYRDDNRTRRYIDALRSASRYSPEIIEIEIKIADYYNEEEQYKEAARHYERVLEKLPNNEDVLTKLAGVYEKMAQVDSAIMIYKTLLELKPGDIGIINKVNELKIKLYESDLPSKYKSIFFKDVVTREDVAALLGHYFDKHLIDRPPVIIRDISGSYAREHIIKICSLNIMTVRPDHSFDRFSKVNRAAFAVILDSLLKYLDRRGHVIDITPLEEVVEPADISPLHKDYKTIKYLVNAGIMKLDPENRFNSTQDVSPSEALAALRKILYNTQ